MPQIEVSFRIDANGILNVSAKDKATGKEQSVRIEGSAGLGADEIDRMVKDSEAHSSDDKARRESIEKKNSLDSMVYQAEKTIQENGEKLDEAMKSDVEGVIASAKQDLESDDAARIDAGLQRLQAELHKVAEVLYKAEAAPGDAGAPDADAGSSPSDDDVIDAEYTEASDEKREEG